MCINYVISLILQRISSQIILPLFKISRREWIIHFKPSAISLRDSHPEELKAIAILRQERESFGRTTLGIKSPKMLLMSFSNNVPSWSISPAPVCKIPLLAVLTSLRRGQWHRTLLQGCAMPQGTQCCDTQVAKWSEYFLQTFSPLHSAHIFFFDHTQ